ncbi:hypothetical protein [Micromonospora zhanjiangensis]|uniref:Uncharacterized protein n=1 Tax=Micromonospora zhanjiangensis TaxID=1522057 RepID=A0ABV8KWM9_9ACTN
MSTHTATNQPGTRQMPDTQTRRMPDTQTRQMGDMQTRQMQNMAPSTRQMPDGRRARRVLGNETKPSVLSTEFWIYLASVGAVLLASYLVGQNAFGVDIFRAPQAWQMITVLTAAYLVSRGIAKAGSSWRHSDRHEQ